MLKFNKKKHTYTRGGIEYISVSELIGNYFSKFDGKAVARKLAKFPVNKANKRGVRYWLNLWKQQQEYGTTVHKDIQGVLMRGDDPQYSESLHAMIWFNAYERKLNKPHVRSEVMLFNEEYRIAGTSDLVIYQGDTVAIIDWKVVKNIQTTDAYGGKESKLGTPDSNFWKYSIQLNMYAWMLRQQGFNTNEMILVQLTPNGVKEFKVPGMIEEVHKILKDRMEELK